ncbi:MAG: hypothetical protein KIT80_23400 [Chitinophagaceae bacterium]|nr:hypothetical protein [Nitrosomonas sp.]MCW5929886.1 hypothetical protein [Chitinophagaceae bacterium]
MPEEEKEHFNPKPKRVLTEEELTQVEALAAFLTIPQIADYFMMGQATFSRILERQPEAMIRYKKGKANVIRDVANSLITKARDGDTASQIFFLKTQAGWREKTEEELSQSEGRRLPIKVVIESYDARNQRNTV